MAASPSNFIPNADQFNIPTYQDQIGKQTQFNLVNSISTTLAAHSLKFGIDYRRLTPVLGYSQYAVVVGFGSLSDYQQGTTSFAVVIDGHKPNPAFLNLSAFAEDHWKVTKRLSVDYGLRWEYNPAPGAIDNIYPLALTSSNLALADVAPQGTPQYHTVYHNFAPRFGFAYTAVPAKTHPLTVRGGYGIFYDTGQALGVNGYLGYPFFGINFVTTGNPLPLPLPASDLAPPTLTFPVVLTQPYGFLNGINDPNLKLPYFEEWNLSLDQRLSSKNTLTASYLGSVSHHLLFTESIQGGSLVNSNFSTNGMFYTDSAASANYGALQVQDQGYLAPGMQVVASYTWAHAIDNASSDLSGNPPLRGNSNNDLRQVLNLAMNYRIPALARGQVQKTLSEGWSINNRLAAQTGYPFTVSQGSYLQINGTFAPILPDLVPGVSIYEHHASGALGGWALNPAAFSPVPTDPNTGVPLRQGTLGRNYIHGPAFWSLNTGIQRTFQIYERLDLLFRVEAFNIFNHPNAGNISSALDSPTFGVSAAGGSGGVSTVGVGNHLYATGAARSLQLALKLQF